ncbi:unnamed protein product [Ectocarpus sp. 12 AP-2014]
MRREEGTAAGGTTSPDDPTRAFAPEEKSRRPKDTPFRQQRVTSFLPILQPLLVVGIFFAIGVAFIPLGKWFIDESEEVVEFKRRYDGDSVDVEGCKITERNQGTTCSVQIEVDEFMKPPIYVYYELNNYFQNHRRYVKSRSSLQLLGEAVEPDENCEPLERTTVGGEVVDLNPCGLIANSMFNDIIELTTENVTMSEKDISWKSDRETRFKQPPGFTFAECSADTSCSDCLGGSKYSSCGDHTDESTGTEYKFWYPDDEKTQFLHETYPEVVSPIEGVLNEHFIVWMRTAGLPRFRKLYGRIDEQIEAPQVLTFNITANFFVGDFSGEKSLVVSNLSLMGARNPYLGIAYIALGSLSLAIGLAFLIKHLSNPRKLGDTRFLVWKDTTL